MRDYLDVDYSVNFAPELVDQSQCGIKRFAWCNLPVLIVILYVHGICTNFFLSRARITIAIFKLDKIPSKDGVILARFIRSSTVFQRSCINRVSSKRRRGFVVSKDNLCFPFIEVERLIGVFEETNMCVRTSRIKTDQRGPWGVYIQRPSLSKTFVPVK